MKVVILAGGRGTRLDHDRPKPMVEIGGIPMLTHIMGIYQQYGYNEFLIATGYKGEVIREYYAGDPNIVCLATGLDSGTGKRVRQCAREIEDEAFLLTYGDGVADVNIAELVRFHHAGTITVTAVHPPARFGQLVLFGSLVEQFNEKPIGQTEWINGGFFVVDTKMAQTSTDSWEQDFLPKVAPTGRIRAYKHTGFWQCMDTQRDLDYLKELWKAGAPWVK